MRNNGIGSSQNTGDFSKFYNKKSCEARKVYHNTANHSAHAAVSSQNNNPTRVKQRGLVLTRDVADEVVLPLAINADVQCACLRVKLKLKPCRKHKHDDMCISIAIDCLSISRVPHQSPINHPCIAISVQINRMKPASLTSTMQPWSLNGATQPSSSAPRLYMRPL